jgi:signal transduction histidine kinase
VLADRERALEVLTNLLDNALRYAPAESTITVVVGPVGHAVRLCVRDQGPGILPADRQRIFERFYTADRARSGGVGTGLGLSIARHIVSRLGGEIWVADETPGATLCFTLPRVAASS